MGYLTSVWTGLPGVETVDYNINIDEYSKIVVFYNEVDKKFITDCDDGANDVFQNFALKILEQEFNCSNICNPLWLEPILNTVNHDLEDCIESADYYCMYSDQTVNLITPLAPATLKSCSIKTPKIKDAKTQREESETKDDVSDFHVTIEMGSNREIHIEYLIYDTLSLIGTIGGTLGLFVGFSFYDFLAMIIHFVFQKIEEYMIKP